MHPAARGRAMRPAILGLLALGASGEWCTDRTSPLCVGDGALRSRWQGGDMPQGSTAWTARERAAVRAALATPATTVRDLDLPRVYVYPFPPEFVDIYGLLKKRLPAAQVAKLSPNITYFDFAGGLDPSQQASESWGPEALGPRGEVLGRVWTPSATLVGRWNEASAEDRGHHGGAFCKDALARGDADVVEGRCVLERFSQHAMAQALHRALAVGYPNIVTKPKDADLFFIPDHFISTLVERHRISKDQWCSVVGPVWLRHLRKFRTKREGSFLGRRNLEDHFFAIGRAWHHPADRKKTENLKRLERFGVSEDCGYRWALRGAHRLVLESQYNYNRACARVHPVPYQGFLAWDDRPAFGADWFGTVAAGPGERRTRVTGFFATPDGKDPSGTRDKFAAACAAMDDCERLADDTSPVNTHFEAAYRDSTFTFQPCGHSAVRKGIVDSIDAGAVPVLAAAEPDFADWVSAKDQRDLWPWNWPQQGASSIILRPDQLDDVPGALAEVDAEQLGLLQRVLARAAPGMAYPLAARYRTLRSIPAAYAASADRPPNGLELILHHLRRAVAMAPANATLALCEEEVEAIFRKRKPGDLAGFRAARANATAKARAIGAGVDVDISETLNPYLPF